MILDELIGKRVCRTKPVILESISCTPGELGEVHTYMRPDEAILVVGLYEDNFVVISDKNPTAPYLLPPYFYDDGWVDLSSCINDIEMMKKVNKKDSSEIKKLMDHVTGLIDDTNDTINSLESTAGMLTVVLEGLRELQD